MADRSFLDWPFLDDTHRALADDLERWCGEHLTGGHDEGDVDAACRELVRRLGDGGWLRYCVPSAYGGAHDDLDVRSLALIRETLARYDGLADFAFAMQGLGSGTISLFGSEAQKAKYLPAVARGEKIAAFALTEPDSGSNVAAMTTSARRAGDGWVVDGAKTYISNGGIADCYVLFARTGEAPGAKGISAFIVDADAGGIAHRRPHPRDRAAPAGDVDVRCDAAAGRCAARRGGARLCRGDGDARRVSHNGRRGGVGLCAARARRGDRARAGAPAWATVRSPTMR